MISALIFDKFTHVLNLLDIKQPVLYVMWNTGYYIFTLFCLKYVSLEYATLLSYFSTEKDYVEIL